MMNQTTAQRAWRLPSGLQTDCRIRMVEGRDAIRQSIRMLLSTVPGERVMRPRYGCPLQNLLFAPNDDTTAGLAIHYVREAIERWERRIEILSLDAGPSPLNPNSLWIEMEYRIRTTGAVDALQMEYNLSGDATA